MTQEIIKAALLGTDQYLPQPIELPDGLSGRIQVSETSKEDRFLKLAISVLLYEEAGRMPVHVEATVAQCAPDERPQAAAKVAGMIQSALASKEEVLFQYLVHRVNKAQLVLPPPLAPLLLNKALEQKKMAGPLVSACGATGQWLCTLNEKWQPLREASDDNDTWETGSLEQRKQYLTRVRRSEPAKAVALLDAVIAQENAANRLSLLEPLHENLSLADEAFLQKLMADKSQKVKETAVNLLAGIQGSALNQPFLEHLLKAIHIREERHLLIARKKVLSIREDVVPDEALFKAGIEKVSSVKGVADHMHVITQLIPFIDPAILAGRLELAEQELIDLFLQHDAVKHLIPVLASAATRFKNKAWALAIMRTEYADNIQLLQVLPKEERMPFYEQFLASGLPAALSNLLDEDYTILPVSLAKRIMAHLLHSPYQIMPAVYQRLALQLPDEMKATLQGYAADSKEDYQTRYFKSQAGAMLQLLDERDQLKNQL